MDTRITSGNSYHTEKTPFNMDNKSKASSAEYFLHFLPIEFIKNVIIPNTNEHARIVMNNWVDITFLEYLTWITLLMVMTVCHRVNKKAYWRMGRSHFFLSVDFTEYMSYDRFNFIIQFHMFEISNGEKEILDPLYQIRDYLRSFNETLANTMVPGRYLCVDETMNQWLECGMTNLKKVPRKPHPIGQELKTLTDYDTSCILQLDTVSDPVKKNTMTSTGT
ncbi:hypothetical protein G6F56_005406 [Rhizopus delemar]|nr:hypothetical protein G6F56_005406 [Rhizopus delemar]